MLKIHQFIETSLRTACGEAIQLPCSFIDCFVVTLLAMTGEYYIADKAYNVLLNINYIE
jgi:hypothetical protein